MITAVVFVATVPAVTVKFAVVHPAGTVTDPGTVRAVLLLESVTAAPLVPATLESVTVQVALPPGPRLLAEQESAVTVGVVNTRLTEAVFEPLFQVAVTVAVRPPKIVPAVAVKVALVVPAATVTDAGTVKYVVLLDNVTAAPLVPATLDNVTVHVALPPELKLEGEHETELIVGVVNVKLMEALFVLPL